MDSGFRWSEKLERTRADNDTFLRNTHRKAERAPRCDTSESPRASPCATLCDRISAASLSPTAEPRRSAACPRAPDDPAPFRRRHTRASTSADRRPGPWWVDAKRTARTGHRRLFPADLRKGSACKTFSHSRETIPLDCIRIRKLRTRLRAGQRPMALPK